MTSRPPHAPVPRDQRVRAGVLRLCDALERIDPSAMREPVARVRADLDARLRLAVVGRVKAGKSTLVNALVGRRVAATGDEECTSLVARYLFGAPERAELVIDDGARITVPFDEGLPSELPVPESRVSHAEVFLQEATLHDYELIDTPGLASSTTEREAATRRGVVSAHAAVAADALIYVFRDVQRADDVALLEEFQSVSGGRTGSASRSIGVLSHADDVGAGTWGRDDPLEVAARHAADIAATRTADLATVLPVAGRMAEAARTGSVREHDARLLALLAQADDSVLRDGDGDLPHGVAWDDLDRLARRVGEYGLRNGRRPAAAGASALAEWLTSASGIERLRSTIATTYLARRRPLAALQRIRQLEDAAYASQRRAELRSAIEAALGSDDLHPLAELRVWEVAAAKSRDLDAVRELERVMDARDDDERLRLPPGSSPMARSERSRELSAHAQRLALLAVTRIEREVHRTLARSFALAG